MADRTIIRLVTGDAISAMVPGELGYDGAGKLILAGFAGIPVVAGTSPVSSVAGRTGAVTLTTADISGLDSAATHPASDFATPTDTATRLAKASNLSDLASVPTARTNLGLGGAALLDVGTVAGKVAAGDDSRIVAAVQTITKAGLATTTDVPAGRAAVVKDTLGGTVRLVFNDAGTLKGVALT